jgi:hypothetical protein
VTVILALSNTVVELAASDRWVINFAIFDDDGSNPATYPIPVVTVTFPNGSTSTPDVVQKSDDSFQAALTLNETGRSVANVYAENYGVLGFVAYGIGNITTATGMPNLTELKGYLTDGSNAPEDQLSISDTELQRALDTEAAAQRRVCNVPAVYPDDLREALKRRVARNLALRGLPVMVLQGDAETGSLVPPGRDPETRRLEAGYRKLVQP